MSKGRLLETRTGHDYMFAHTLAKLSSRIPFPIKSRFASLRPLYTKLMGMGQSVVSIKTDAGEMRWHIDGSTYQSFLAGDYEREMQGLFLLHVRDGMTVYDVGAHSGFHSLFCSLLVGASGRVISFEPHPLTQKSLALQIAANPQLNITACTFALSDSCGEVLMSDGNNESEAHISPHGTMSVKTRTLDSLIAEGFPVPHVIKIDVEGHEEAVLLGGMETLRQHHPLILCDRNDHETWDMLRRVLEPVGYELFGYDPAIAIPALD